MPEHLPVRVLVDVNGTLYIRPEGKPIPIADESLKDSDLLQSGHILEQVRRNKRGSNRFSPIATINRFANDLRDLYEPVRVLENDMLNPKEAEGLNLLATSVDLTGERPKITLFSNIPQRKEGELTERIKKDGLYSILDPIIPVLLRPNDSIQPALFKYSGVGLFEGEGVYVVDDDPYIAELIRRGYRDVKVYVVGNAIEVAQRYKRQENLKLPPSFNTRTDGEPLGRGGTTEIYKKLIGSGYIKALRV